MLKPPRLHEILSSTPVTVSATTSLHDALALMKSENTTAIVVVEEKRPIGIFTERDVLRMMASGNRAENMSVGGMMTCPPITASPDLDFFEAYHLCASRKIRHLIVVDHGGELYGLASESDFLRILGVDVTSSDQSIDQDMIRLPLLLPPDTPLLDALRGMNPESGSVAIATLDNKLIGILTERDTIRLAQTDIAKLSLADVMTSPVLTIPLGSSIYFAIDQMRRHGVRRLVVLNGEGYVVGLFTEHDVVKRIENRYIEFLSTVIKRQINDLNAARHKLDDSAVLTSILRESLDMALVATDIEGVIRYLNPEAASLLGSNSPDAEGRRLAELVKQAGLDDKHVDNGIAAAKRGERYQAELSRKQMDGKQVLRSRIAPILDEASAILGYVQTLQDITEHKRTVESLRQSASIFENTVDGIVVTDAACNIVAVNPAFMKITGYSEAEVLGQNPRMLNSGRQDSQFYQHMWDQVRQLGYWQGEIWNRRKNGEVYAEWLTINAIKDADDAIVKYIGVFADITALKRSQEQYEFLAHHDPLTGLPNRLLCHARLEYALRRAKRYRDVIAVMMLDLDDFKAINDNYGHQAGDLLLQEAAKRMLSTLRNNDTAARLGGDEFVVVVESVTDKQNIAAIAEKMVLALSEPYLLNTVGAAISVSIGIAMSPQDGEDVETLLKRSDIALYEVKARGRNAYRFYQGG